MRISWRELDWISEGDRHAIERRMEMLGGTSGGLDRVDFSGREAGKSGSFEIRITANAAKRQIIAIRRDAQRAKAFNMAFEALERSVASVLKLQGTQPARETNVRAALANVAAVSPRPSLGAVPAASRWGWLVQRGARTALALLGVLVAFAMVALWSQHATRAGDAHAAREDRVFSAVAKIPAEALEAESAFSAIARLGRADSR